MLIYDLLKKDHREVKHLFQRIEECLENQQYSEAEATFEELRMELTAHAKAEQESFYEPLFLLSREKEGKDLAWEGEEEHHVIALLLNELSRMEIDDGSWKAKVKVLSEIVDHHVQEEEGDIFKEAKKCFSNAEAQKIADNMKTLKEQYKEMVDSVLAQDIEILMNPMRTSLLTDSQFSG